MYVLKPEQLNDNHFSLEKIQELVEMLEPKIVYVNKETYDSIIKRIDFQPMNLIINNFISDNQAVVISEKMMEEMKKPTPIIQFY